MSFLLLQEGMKLNFTREIWVDGMQTLTAASASPLPCTPVALEQSHCLTITTVQGTAGPLHLCACATSEPLH